MNKQLMKKIAGGLTLGCLLLSFGAVSLASEPANPSDAPPVCAGRPAPNLQEMKQHLSNTLNNLVGQGTISQKQADSVLKFLEKKGEERKADMEKMKNMTPEERHAYMENKFKNHPDIVADLQKAAGLTAEQAKTVADAIRPPHFPGPGPMISGKLDALVEQGTITKEQEDKISQFFKEKGEQHRAEMEKMRQMTPDERQKIKEEHFKNRPDIIGDLEKAAGLSEDQAKTVADALRPPHGPCPKGPGPEMP